MQTQIFHLKAPSHKKEALKTTMKTFVISNISANLKKLRKISGKEYSLKKYEKKTSKVFIGDDTILDFLVAESQYFRAAQNSRETIYSNAKFSPRSKTAPNLRDFTPQNV